MGENYLSEQAGNARKRRDRSLEEGLATLTSAAAGISDPGRVIAAVLSALGSTDPEDDTCVVALRVL